MHIKRIKALTLRRLACTTFLIDLHFVHTIYVPHCTPRKIILNNSNIRVTIGFGKFAIHGESSFPVRPMCTCLQYWQTCWSYCYICGSMINYDRTIRVHNRMIRTYSQPCRIKSSKVTRTQNATGRDKKKRRITSYIAKGLRRAIPSQRAIRLASRDAPSTISFFLSVLFFFFCSYRNVRNIAEYKDSVTYIVYGRVLFPQDRVINLRFDRHSHRSEIFSMLRRKILYFHRRNVLAISKGRKQKIPYYFYAGLSHRSNTERLKLKYLFYNYYIL